MIAAYSGDRDASLNADDMASQTVRLKEEQLRKEEEKVIIMIGLYHISHPPLLFYGTHVYEARV